MYDQIICFSEYIHDNQEGILKRLMYQCENCKAYVDLKFIKGISWISL